MIRKALLNDLNRIFDIRQEASQRLHMLGINQWQSEKPSIDDFRQDIINQSCFVYEIDGVIYGMATFQITYDLNYENVIDSNINALTIHRIAVSNDKTHQGIGHALMDYAETYARSIQKKVMLIDTHPKNHYMQNLIKAHHYQYVATITLLDIPSPKRFLYRKSLT
jgi:GNAT superfamily N-acetyltransferase